jgi:hypothetical protein
MHAVHGCTLPGFACDVQWHGLANCLSTGLSSGLSTGLFTNLSTSLPTGRCPHCGNDHSLLDHSTKAEVQQLMLDFYTVTLACMCVQCNAQHHCDHAHVICNASLFKRKVVKVCGWCKRRGYQGVL